ncbi:MAG: hypothetical protein R3C24_07960 [Cyanobacteriota/Melainabacteria group bacterium]|nr:hypothetical protein [Candidatus Obscuribacterales bacterium]
MSIQIDPSAQLANGDQVGEKPFFTLEAPQPMAEGDFSICMVPLPAIPGDVATGTFVRRKTYGEAGENHTVARFSVPRGTKIIGVNGRSRSEDEVGEDTDRGPSLVLAVPRRVAAMAEMEIHLLHARKGSVDWSPTGQGLPVPAGLSYVGSYRYRSYAYGTIFVFQPERYLA